MKLFFCLPGGPNNQIEQNLEFNKNLRGSAEWLVWQIMHHIYIKLQKEYIECNNSWKIGLIEVIVLTKSCIRKIKTNVTNEKKQEK